MQLTGELEFESQFDIETATPCELGQFGDCQTNVELPIYNVKGGPAQKSRGATYCSAKVSWP